MIRIHRLRRYTRLTLLGLSATLLAGHAAAAFKVVGYFPTWQGDVNGIPYNKVTHINYSFVLPTATGGLQPLDGGGARLQSLVQQAHGKGVKVLIAVGGWNNGDDSAFRSLAANSGYRAAFVQNLLNLVQQYNLDGVDIDWEYPDGAEVANFKQLMSELSNALRSRGKLLTAAVTANDWPGSFDRTSINYVDFLNLMVYDMGTPHSTYDMARNALAHWKTNEGLPKEKAVLGVPFYSHTGWVTYRDIIARYGTWAADRDDAGGLDYNGRPTIRAKSQLALNEGGGVMFWEISQDTRDTTSLMSTIWDVVGSATIDNPPPTGNVCFFEHTHYQGASACFGEGSFNTSGDWNDRASSVRVAAGYRADLFEHGNYTGRLLTLTGDEPNLVNRNFNDLMTSFRIGRNGGSSVANGRYNLGSVDIGFADRETYVNRAKRRSTAANVSMWPGPPPTTAPTSSRSAATATMPRYSTWSTWAAAGIGWPISTAAR